MHFYELANYVEILTSLLHLRPFGTTSLGNILRDPSDHFRWFQEGICKPALSQGI